MKFLLFGIALNLFGCFFALAEFNVADFGNTTLGLVLCIAGMLSALIGLVLPDRKK
ncbi:MAG: hypothetical protein LBR72_01665 [Oscillospiraceae bacterium]|jgi:uncharacterized membrane protein YidH (DUF202 family)|nr:hypothetical protein [Oscillospiraceae bacterium]